MILHYSCHAVKYIPASGFLCSAPAAEHGSVAMESVVMGCPALLPHHTLFPAGGRKRNHVSL